MHPPVTAFSMELKAVSLAYHWAENNLPPASLRLISYHGHLCYVKVINAFFSGVKWRLPATPFKVGAPARLERPDAERQRGSEIDKMLRPTWKGGRSCMFQS